MSSRSSFVVDRATLLVLWLGMFGFVALHSFAIPPNRGDPAVTSFRVAWFGGLGLVTALLVYVGLDDDSTPERT